MDGINYDVKFKVDLEKLSLKLAYDHTYYAEFIEDDKVIVWWEENDGWDYSKEYTKFDFDEKVKDGIWLIIQ